MKFDTLLKDGDSVHYDGDEYFRASVHSECWHCKQETHYISINFEAFLCSTECADAKWHEYEIASLRR